MSGPGFAIKDIVKTRTQPAENNRAGYLIPALTTIMVILLTLTAQNLFGRFNWGLELGLLPLLSLGLSWYFIQRSQLLIARRYKGTLSEIKNRVIDGKSIYLNNMRRMLAVSLAIVIITAVLGFRVMTNPETLAIYIITASGSILLNVIIINSMVLPLFAKTRISLVSMLMVASGVLLSVTFIKNDLNSLSSVYLLCALLGCSISSLCVFSLRVNFEYKMFRNILN